MKKDTRTIEDKVESLAKLGVHVEVVTELTNEMLQDPRLILGKIEINRDRVGKEKE